MRDDEPTVDCGVHGPQPVSFACTHIAHSLLNGKTPGFVIEPDDDHPLPLAWCEGCERGLTQMGRNWASEEWRAGADFKLLCAGCYAEAKGLAISANRFRNRCAALVRSDFRVNVML